MPIRFYCPFCDRLLAIGSQKAGAVVECPACRGGVGVPSPGGPASPLVPVGAGPLVLGWGQVAGLGVGLMLLAGIAFVAGLLVGALG